MKEEAERKGLGLEEDDELEEFDLEDWNEDMEDEFDVKQWEEDWDDQEPDDEFTYHLRQELLKP